MRHARIQVLMRRSGGLIFIVFVTFLSSCSLVGHKERPSPSLDTRNHRVIKRETLQKGGKIVVIPFKPGVKVIADKQMDRTALMIIKGITARLHSGSTAFEVVLADRAKEADFIIEGKIISMRSSSKFKQWLFGKKGVALSVEGKMVTRLSNDVVLVFSDIREENNKESSFKKLGYLVGIDIAQMILSEHK